MNIITRASRNLPFLVSLFFVLSFCLYFTNLTHFVSPRMKEFLGYDMNVNYGILLHGAHLPRHAISTIGIKYIINLLSNILVIPEQSAMITVLAFNAGINVALFFLLIMLLTKNRACSILFAVAYCFSFSSLTAFSIPETYSLSACLVLLFFVSLVKTRPGASTRGNVFSAGAVLLASLNNVSLISLHINNLFSAIRSVGAGKENVLKGGKADHELYFSRVLVPTVFLLLSYYLCGALVFGWNFLCFIPQLTRQYASFGHLLSVRYFINVFIGFVFYSFIAPARELLPRLGITDIRGYLNGFDGIILCFIYLCFLVYAAAYFVKNRDTLTDGILLWLSSFYLLYIYYDPWEPLLFSSLVVPAVFMLFAKAYNNLELKYKNLIFSIFLVILALRNIVALYGPILD